MVSSGQFVNVMISNNYDPEEPSIMINPKNPQIMVAGANISSFYYSSDAGLTWQEGQLTSTSGVWGDPVIITDTNENFYFFHLSSPIVGHWIDRIVCQKSTDLGHTWSDGSYFGLNGLKDEDKEWAVVDRNTNVIHACWTEFDSYGSANPQDSSRILYVRSSDGGLTWSPPKKINRVSGDCLDENNTVEGAVPAIGPNGEIYTSWAGPLGLVFTHSLDGGTTWPDTNIFVCDLPGGWFYNIPGIYRGIGLPVTSCNLCPGPFYGQIYINWADQRNGPGDTDVWFVKSTDGGHTWTAPKRVNDDPPGNQQFFSWMDVDPVTGFIYIVFYDRRNYSNNNTDVYLAVSRDGGETFQNMQISESPFNPDQSIFFGDYSNISAFNNIVRPIWARLDGASLSVYTAIIDSLYTVVQPVNNPGLPVVLDQNYPNPAREVTYFTYKVHQPAIVTLKVYDVFGREITTLVDHRQVGTGKYIERFDFTKFHLKPGIYYFSLISGEKSIQRKMIIN
jgi:hypothetical protein